MIAALALLVVAQTQATEPAANPAGQQPAAPQPAVAARPSAPVAPQRPDTAQLYAQLFPPAEGDEDTQPLEEPIFEYEAGVARPEDDTRGDFGLGPLRFRPSITFSYVSADSAFFAGAVEDEEDYFQVQPSLGFRFALPGLRFGRLAVTYEPRFRAFTDVAQLRKATHEVIASFDAPAGSTVDYGISDHFTAGILETTQVDPGREYFPTLSRFERNMLSGYVRLRPGAFRVEAGGSTERVRFGDEEVVGFTEYDRHRARFAPLYAIGEDFQVGPRYEFERIPPHETRPAQESTAHSILFGVQRGVESGSLLTGHAWVGYRSQDSPQAGPGGRTFEDAVFDVALQKEFTRDWRLRLHAGRLPQLSGFETNAFYVNRYVGAELSIPLPAEVIFAATAMRNDNEYRVASSLGPPREDEITSWSVGLGRSITRYAFLRVDYRDEERDSNLDAFDIDAQAVIVQLGIGVFGPPISINR
ncbi:MAG TPA: outer membrane beta-barrel protein [Vicinamibacteria bacterium]|nr:outer membrane beta-barrel protein [Vicinamibacteria bacterium]